MITSIGLGEPIVSDSTPEDEFVTVGEVTRRLRVSKMTVYRQIHNGTMPAVRFGRGFRIPRKAFEELIRPLGVGE